MLRQKETVDISIEMHFMEDKMEKTGRMITFLFKAVVLGGGCFTDRFSASGSGIYAACWENEKPYCRVG